MTKRKKIWIVVAVVVVVVLLAGATFALVYCLNNRNSTQTPGKNGADSSGTNNTENSGTNNAENSGTNNAENSGSSGGSGSVVRTEKNTYYTGDYYDNLNTNLTGAEFRAELAKLITDTHKNYFTYNDLKDVYKTTDADPDNPGNVIWFYTGSSAQYNGIMDTNTGYPTGYPSNREHVWPKDGGKAFPETTEAGSDAHHVRPLNSGLNNTRSSNHFGEVPQTTTNRVLQSGTYANYGTTDPDTWCYQAIVNGNKLFYPAAGYRGATARILFYVQTRWGDVSNLSFTLGVSTSKVMSNVDILMKWHLEEPPTEEEIRRNDLVASVQGNRNPFIDHPGYAELIYCNDGQSYNNKLQEVVATYGSYYNFNDTSVTALADIDLLGNNVAAAANVAELNKKYAFVNFTLSAYRKLNTAQA